MQATLAFVNIIHVLVFGKNLKHRINSWLINAKMHSLDKWNYIIILTFGNIIMRIN